ncbi:hypothetical protein CVT26_011977 [Gymnopilus dilepis]|uniref:Uncharacterized protein n=1 Tax=Gymnopilus dilepis TaxID=231916 RepID=A0A409VYM4_9AGAR|nr:hypothetical protein CVT26_011977 [Gymnopilus dilepis]
MEEATNIDTESIIYPSEAEMADSHPRSAKFESEYLVSMSSGACPAVFCLLQPSTPASGISVDDKGRHRRRKA